MTIIQKYLLRTEKFINESNLLNEEKDGIAKDNVQNI